MPSHLKNILSAKSIKVTINHYCHRLKATLITIWIPFTVVTVACLLSVSCATNAFFHQRKTSRPPAWNPTLEIATGTAQAYVLDVQPLAGGGRRYDVLLRGLLRDRPTDRAFRFSVNEEPGTVADVALAEASLVAVGDRRGRPLEIWFRGEAPTDLTCHDDAPDQVLVAPPTWKGALITFPLTWRTPEGDLHQGNLTLHLDSQHQHMLRRLSHDVVTITGGMGLSVVDLTFYVGVVAPFAIIFTPIAAIDKHIGHP